MSEPWTNSQRNELAALCGAAGFAFSHLQRPFFCDFRGVVGDGRGQRALTKTYSDDISVGTHMFFFPRLGFMDVPI